jgi:prefoldin subunit 5
MRETELTQSESDWREKIWQRRALLYRVRNELIELEAELSEQLAAINAFEFRLRAKVKPLISRLEALEAEIEGLLQQLHRAPPEEIKEEWSSWSFGDQGAAAAGEFRYRERVAPSMPPRLDKEDGAKLKRLYRQLARRFHPDMAVDETDRSYRTNIMMAVNAAYAASDLEKLKELSLEPDVANRLEYVDTDEQLAEALQQEIERCQRRIAEIKRELKTLSDHENFRLLNRVQAAKSKGRDAMAEIVANLQDLISRKLVERDVLKGEVENSSEMTTDLQGDAFAEAIWDLTLEQSFEADPETGYTEWILNRQKRYGFDDDILDDSD